MSYETDDSGETLTTKSPKAKNAKFTLRQAIEYGEYDVEYLSTFPEWHTLSRHIQFEYLNEAIDNRRKQLLQHWATINRTSNWSVRDDLKEASKNIEKQLDQIEKDRERILIEYSK